MIIRCVLVPLCKVFQTILWMVAIRGEKQSDLQCWSLQLRSLARQNGNHESKSLEIARLIGKDILNIQSFRINLRFGMLGSSLRSV